MTKDTKVPSSRKVLFKVLFSCLYARLLVVVSLILAAHYSSRFLLGRGLTPKSHKEPGLFHNANLTLEYRLVQIYQHGSGDLNYRYHRRLDVTPEYLKRQEGVFVESNIEFDYNNASDDEEMSYHGKNLLHAILPVKKRANALTITRLGDRHTPNFIDLYLNYAISTKNKNSLKQIELEWVEEDEYVPDMTDRNSILSLAVMLLNAYVRLPKDNLCKNLEWTNLGDEWEADPDHDIDFGWNKNGVRGHVFINQNHSSIILAIKGTSGAVLPGGGSEETALGDKLNDNLLFSCCCARVSYAWTTVCDCYSGTYTCNQDCLEHELNRQDRYYHAVLEVYRNVTAHYPGVPIWVTGHSLGGALAVLLARTYGLPAVVFQAPGEMLATNRLHLPMPPGIPPHLDHIWHIGHTADPIYMGVCNGVSSSCNAGGYAMETACHTGLQCVYDTVKDLGWRVNLLNHRIRIVIDSIISVYNSTPECFLQPPCKDCFNWRFVSKDDSVPDEPSLPNPLKPPAKTVLHTHSLSHTNNTSRLDSERKDPTPTDTPNCLKRNWYGWCIEWDTDQD